MRRTLRPFVRLLLAGAVAVVLVPVISAFTTVTVRVGDNPGPLAVIPQSGEVAVVNSGTDDVSVVDRDTLHVSTVHTGSLPAAIAVNRATGYAYIADSLGNTVTAFYGYGEGKKRKTYAVGVGPINVAVNAATNRVYSVNNEDGTVSAINENTGTTVTIPVGQRPRGIAVNEATNRIYVANIWDDSVTVIDGSTNAVIATLPVVVYPYDVAVNPLTNKIYVGSGDGFAVSVIDGATHARTDVPSFWQPAFLAVNTVTTTIYAIGAQTAGGVLVIDGATDTAIQIATPPGPWGFSSLSAVKVNETTNQIYVVDSTSKNLLVIDGHTNELTVRALDFEPCSVAIDPTINRVYVSHCNYSRISILDE